MAEDFTVTPWKVTGEIDYDLLQKKFGTVPIDDGLLKRLEKYGEVHPMLRRGIFYSHRDLNQLLDKFDKGEEFVLYTGRGPSGNTHLGHVMPWMFAKWLQDVFDVHMLFQMTDDEKFLFQDLTLEQTRGLAYENALDFAALGFNPEKTRIILDTENIRIRQFNQHRFDILHFDTGGTRIPSDGRSRKGNSLSDTLRNRSGSAFQGRKGCGPGTGISQTRNGLLQDVPGTQRRGQDVLLGP